MMRLTGPYAKSSTSDFYFFILLPAPPKTTTIFFIIALGRSILRRRWIRPISPFAVVASGVFRKHHRAMTLACADGDVTVYSSTVIADERYRQCRSLNIYVRERLLRGLLDW